MLAGRYVGGAVREQPGAFCFIRAFGTGEGPGAQLLGLRPPSERSAAGERLDDGGVRIGACPAGYTLGSPDEGAYSSSATSTRIPLLDALEP